MTTRLTREQAAVLGAYTGITCGPFADVHRYAEEKLGRPIFTHEFASVGMADRLRVASKSDFLRLCAMDEVKP